MAQSRSLSVITKYEELVESIREVEKDVSKLLKDASQLRKKFFGSKGKSDASKNKINSEDIQAILQEAQNLDNHIMKTQNLLHRCNILRYYIQRQLELKNCQNQNSSPLYM